MTTLWDSIRQGLIDSAKIAKEQAQIAAEKADELGKKGKIKLDLTSTNRKIEKQFTELGGKAYHLIAEENVSNIAKDETVAGIINAIRDLETELKNLQEEYAAVGAADPAAEPAAEVVDDEPEKPKEEK